MTGSLAYIGLGATRFEEWREFAATVGFDAVSDRDSLRLRLDAKPFRVLVSRAAYDDLAMLGFEANGPTDLDGAIAALDAAGTAWRTGDGDLCRERAVDRVICFEDPDGVRIELSQGFVEEGAPRLPLIERGFGADSSGFGHVLFKVANVDRSRAFYEAILGASLSDQIRLGSSEEGARIVFLHFNQRHHSLALMEGTFGSERRLQHFMVEMRELADLGRAYDRMQDSRFGIAQTIGQHSNDRSLSFYVATPSKFWMEIGCNPIRIEDEATWPGGEYDTTSIWGHRPPPSSHGTP